MQDSQETTAADPEGVASRDWERMTLTYVGDAAEVLASGGGKQSTNPNDPGDNIFQPPGNPG